MAAIDYGVMVFRGGKQIYEDELYPEIKIDDITIRCYKCMCDIGKNEDVEHSFWNLMSRDHMDKYSNAKSLRFSAYGIAFHLSELCNMVYQLRFSIDGNHYTVIYGYGIDNDMRLYNQIKIRYLGRGRAKIVDKAIKKAMKQ